MGRVQDKVILVTGGAMGMGQAHCERLASEGVRLFVADMNAELGEAVSTVATPRSDRASRDDTGCR